MEFFQSSRPSSLKNLNISFRPVREAEPELIEKCVGWFNDRDIQDLIFPRHNERSEYVTWTKESLMERFDNFEDKPTYLILDGERPIGEMSFRMDFPLLLKDIEKSAWLAITIGDKKYWRQGIGRKALNFLEKQAISAGAKRVELGIFEFNTNAQKFYESSGYERIGSIPRFVYYKDKVWSNIRMEKVLLT